EPISGFMRKAVRSYFVTINSRDLTIDPEGRLPVLLPGLYIRAGCEVLTFDVFFMGFVAFRCCVIPARSTIFCPDAELISLRNEVSDAKIFCTAAASFWLLGNSRKTSAMMAVAVE